MTTKLALSLCRRRLTILWFGGGLALFLLVVAQTLTNHFGDRVAEVWGWFLPTLLPTLSLILGTLVAEQMGGAKRERWVIDRFFFRLAFLLSALYLALVAATMLLEPLAKVSFFELLKRSNLYLAPIQGLVAAALGVFFVKAEPRGDEKK